MTTKGDAFIGSGGAGRSTDPVRIEMGDEAGSGCLGIIVWDWCDGEAK